MFTSLLPNSGACALIGLSERDYDSIAATDSGWFYKNSDGTSRPSGYGTYNDVENVTGRAWQIPGAVYVKGAAAELRLRFTNPQWNGFNVTLTVVGAKLSVPPPGGGTPTETALSPGGPYSFSLPGSGGSANVTIDLGTLPATVTRGTLMVDIVAKQGSQTLWSTGGWANWEKLWVVRATPCELQEAPWTDLLDLTCTWALGSSGEPAVLQDLTTGMFGSGRFVYNPYGRYFWMNSGRPGIGTNLYNLSGALGAPSAANMDCRDASGFLTLALQSQGSDPTILWLEASNLAEFRTHPLCPMGRDATDVTEYAAVPFAFHQVVSTSSGIFDSSNAYLNDPDGDLHMAPAMAWSLPDAWQDATYQYGLVSNYYNESGNAYVAPRTPALSNDLAEIE